MTKNIDRKTQNKIIVDKNIFLFQNTRKIIKESNNSPSKENSIFIKI